MSERRWLLALALSLLLHLTVIGSPGWPLPLPGEVAAGGVLEGHLTARPPAQAPAAHPPAPPQAAPRAPARRPRAAPAAAAVPGAELPAAAPVPAAAAEAETTSAVEPAGAVEPAPAGATARIAWPREGRIRFVVTRGEAGQQTEIGESIHTWRHDGVHYVLRAETETRGLVALFRQVRIVQTSEGALGPEGLMPLSYAVERKGQPAEGVRFDWAAGKAALTHGGRVRRELALSAGAQDLLSQIYQIGLAGFAARTELMIATGKRYGRYAYEAVGDETLATPFGALRTWHVRTPALPGEQAMELWLAQDHGNLPVRIRFIDREGEVYDQNAVELAVEGASPAFEGR
jgi:hypothetical protein